VIRAAAIAAVAAVAMLGAARGAHADGEAPHADPFGPVVAPASTPAPVPATAAPTSPAPAMPAPPTAAKDPDPAALAAADANLESTARRSGMTFAVALGGGITFGLGVKDAVGRGGGGSFRLGRVATPNTIIQLELAVHALPHRPGKLSPTDPTPAISTNETADLLIGAQHYVNPSLWVRAGIGYGAYEGHDVPMRGQNVSLHGLATVVGGGVDLVRWRHVVLDMEIFSVAMINRQGVLSSSALLLGVAFD
jgi:hypothetical protein